MDRDPLSATLASPRWPRWIRRHIRSVCDFCDWRRCTRQILPSFLNGGRWPVDRKPSGWRISVLGQHPTLGWGFFTLDPDGRHMTRSELAADLPFHLGDSQMSESGTRVTRFQWNALGTALYVEAIVNEVQSIWRVDDSPKRSGGSLPSG